jgi:hypothetical protein
MPAAFLTVPSRHWRWSSLSYGIALALTSLSSTSAFSQTHSAPAPLPLPHTISSSDLVRIPDAPQVHDLTADGHQLLVSITGQRFRSPLNPASIETLSWNLTSSSREVLKPDPSLFPSTTSWVPGGWSSDGHRVVLESQPTGGQPPDVIWWDRSPDLSQPALHSLGQHPFFSTPLVAADRAQLSTNAQIVLFRRQPGSALSPNEVTPEGWFVFLSADPSIVPVRTPDDPRLLARLESVQLAPHGASVLFSAWERQEDTSLLEVLFLQPLPSGPTTRLSIPTHDLPAWARLPRFENLTLSGDGQTAAFSLRGVTSENAIWRGLGLFSLTQPEVRWITTNLWPGQWESPPEGYLPQLDAHGRRLVFQGWPDPSEPTPFPPHRRVFLWDAETQLIQSPSIPALPAQNDLDQFHPTLSPDGKSVAFLQGALGDFSGESPTTTMVWTVDADTVIPLEPQDDFRPVDITLRWSANGEFLLRAFSLPDGSLSALLWSPVTGATQHHDWILPESSSLTGPGPIRMGPNAVSRDGRYVAVLAPVTNSMSSPALNGLHLIDTQSGNWRLLTPGIQGGYAEGIHGSPTLSENAERLLWYGLPTHLVADPLGPNPTWFQWDLTQGQSPTLAVMDANRTLFTGNPCQLSSDGRYAAIEFRASPAGYRILDLPSQLSSPTMGNASIRKVSLSATGHRFAASATTLLTARTAVYETPVALLSEVNPPPPLWRSRVNGRDAILSADGLRVVQILGDSRSPSNTLHVVEVDTDRTLLELPVPAPIKELAFSADGQHLAWTMIHSNAPQHLQAWHLDIQNPVPTLLTFDSQTLAPSQGTTRSLAISPDGRWIAFSSSANSLVPEDNNHTFDVFLHDRTEGRNHLVSRAHLSNGPGREASIRPQFSADGLSLFFLSQASDLIASDHNDALDVFKVTWVASGGTVVFLRRSLVQGTLEVLWDGPATDRYRLEQAPSPAGPWSSMEGVFPPNTPVPVLITADQQFFRTLLVD